MKKIRIGNDIRLLLKVTPNKESGFNTMDDLGQSNIKQVKCYMVKTEDYHFTDLHNKDMFVRVKYPLFYPLTHHNINNSGYPSYFLMPHEIDNHGHFIKNCDPCNPLPAYTGFCIHDRKFEPVPKNWQLVESEVLPTKNQITCMFKAHEQFSCGTYKLIVVLTVFEQGWGKHNLRTYTIDKGNILQLVDDDSGTYGNITIDVDESGVMGNMIKKIEIQESNYIIYPNDTMRIGDIDSDGRLYYIYITLDDGTRVVYDPYNWRFNKLVFTSSNPDLISIDEFGNIKSHDANISNTTVTMFVESSADDNINGRFEVSIKYLYPGDTIRIGFSFNDDVVDFQNIDGTFDFTQLQEYPTDSITYNTSNDADGKYLWVVTNKQIDVITSSSFEVPMLYKNPVVVIGNKYVYRSEIGILQGDMQFKIQYKR